MWYWPFLYYILILELPGLVSSLKTVLNKMEDSPLFSMISSQSESPRTGSHTSSEEDMVWLKDLKPILVMSLLWLGAKSIHKKILQDRGGTVCVKTLEAKTRANLPYWEVFVIYLLC